MPVTLALAMACIGLLGCAVSASGAQSPTTTAKVSPQPMHSGRISPMLFGNFVELLDDLVPAMWAEMLNDRGFDGITKSVGWCYYNGEPNICDREWDANASWTYDAADPFNGPRSAKLTARKSSPGRLTQSGLAAAKGKAYQFSGYLRADNPNVKVTVALKTKLPDGKWMVLGSAQMGKPNAKWQRYNARMVSAGDTDRAVFEIVASGTGSVWVDKLSVMPEDNLRGWRKDVVQAIKDVRPAVIRWGGSVCDPGGYLWKDGIGDRDLRVPFPNRVWGRIDSNDVGIDEFLGFCELVGAEPLVCISFSDGPQSAADLVRYCNDASASEWGKKRAANGHSKPYGVKYWQLGNELGNADYVNGLPEFCTLMKQADKSIRLLSSFPSQDLLNKVGSQIDYIGPHHYTPDFAGCENDFKNLSKMISETPGCAQVKIAVTEWNVSGGAWGLMRGKFLTLETALLNARYLNLLMRHSATVEIACRSNMANSLGSGIIETSPSGLLKRPSYHVMKLYADHAKPVPMKVEHAIPGMDIAACASEDGNSMCVFAVNPTTEPAKLALDLTGLPAGFRPLRAEVVSDTQDARQADVVNAWSAPGRVRTEELSVSAEGLVIPALSVAAIDCGIR